VSLDTNVVTQNKQNKLRTAARILTFCFSLFLFFFSFSLLFEQQLSFLEARFFINYRNFFCFFLFFLPLAFFQRQHKDLVHKSLEQMDAQIYELFRLAPSTNMGQSLGGSEDEQL
jgi:amino acid permease